MKKTLFLLLLLLLAATTTRANYNCVVFNNGTTPIKFRATGIYQGYTCIGVGTLEVGASINANNPSCIGRANDNYAFTYEAYQSYYGGAWHDISPTVMASAMVMTNGTGTLSFGLNGGTIATVTLCFSVTNANTYKIVCYWKKNGTVVASTSIYPGQVGSYCYTALMTDQLTWTTSSYETTPGNPNPPTTSDQTIQITTNSNNGVTVGGFTSYNTQSVDATGGATGGGATAPQYTTNNLNNNNAPVNFSGLSGDAVNSLGFQSTVAELQKIQTRQDVGNTLLAATTNLLAQGNLKNNDFIPTATNLLARIAANTSSNQTPQIVLTNSNTINISNQFDISGITNSIDRFRQENTNALGKILEKLSETNAPATNDLSDTNWIPDLQSQFDAGYSNGVAISKNWSDGADAAHIDFDVPEASDGDWRVNISKQSMGSIMVNLNPMSMPWVSALAALCKRIIEWGCFCLLVFFVTRQTWEYCGGIQGVSPIRANTQKVATPGGVGISSGTLVAMGLTILLTIAVAVAPTAAWIIYGGYKSHMSTNPFSGVGNASVAMGLGLAAKFIPFSTIFVCIGNALAFRLTMIGHILLWSTVIRFLVG